MISPSLGRRSQGRARTEGREPTGARRIEDDVSTREGKERIWEAEGDWRTPRFLSPPGHTPSSTRRNRPSRRTLSRPYSPGYDGSKRVAIPFLDALRRKRGGRESAALKRPAAGRPSSRDEVGPPPTWYASSIASSSNSESRVCWSLCCPVAIAPPRPPVLVVAWSGFASGSRS